MPPPVRPSDKHSSEQGEWWKKDASDREDSDVDRDYERHIDAGERNKEAMEESELPVEFPT